MNPVTAHDLLLAYGSGKHCIRRLGKSILQIRKKKKNCKPSLCEKPVKSTPSCVGIACPVDNATFAIPQMEESTCEVRHIPKVVQVRHTFSHSFVTAIPSMH